MLLKFGVKEFLLRKVDIFSSPWENKEDFKGKEFLYQANIYFQKGKGSQLSINQIFSSKK